MFFRLCARAPRTMIRSRATAISSVVQFINTGTYNRRPDPGWGLPSATLFAIFACSLRFRSTQSPPSLHTPLLEPPLRPTPVYRIYELQAFSAIPPPFARRPAGSRDWRFSPGDVVGGAVVHRCTNDRQTHRHY